MVLLSPTAHVLGMLPDWHTAMIVSQSFSANASLNSMRSAFCVPISTVSVLVFAPSTAVTLHSPASESTSVHVPSAPAVPLTVFEPFVAVTVAPTLVVTTSCGVTPV